MRNIFILLLVFCYSGIIAQPTNPKAGVKWMTFERAQQATGKTPRITVVYIYVEQDEFCKLMDKNVFTNAKVINTLNNEFYAIRFNGQEPQTIIFKGQKFSNSQDNYRLHKLVIPLLSSNNISFPALAFLDENNNLITSIIGYQSIENLLEVLSFIKRQHRRTNWNAHAMFSQAFDVWAGQATLTQPEPKPEPKPEPQPIAQAKPEPPPQLLAQAQVQSQPEPQSIATPVPVVESQPEPLPIAVPEPVVEPLPESLPKELSPISSPAPPITLLTGVIKWYTIEEADQLCKVAPRKFFIDMYTDWCGWCKKMDKETFTDPTLANYINNNYYPVKFDGESKAPITFDNKTYQPQSRTHDLALLLMQGKTGYPTYVILDQYRQPLGILKGYIGIDKLYQTLVFVGGDYYMTSNDKEFQSKWPKIREETDKIYKPKH